MTFDAMADDLMKLIEDKNLGRITLLGHSMVRIVAYFPFMHIFFANIHWKVLFIGQLSYFIKVNYPYYDTREVKWQW